MTDQTQTTGAAEAAPAVTAATAESAPTDAQRIWAEQEAAEQTSESKAASEQHAEDVKAATGKTESTAAPGAAETSQAAEKAAETKEQIAQDIWANATPEQKAAIKAANDENARLVQANRSDRGRIAAFQRENDKLKKAAPAGAADVTDATTAAAYFQTEDWKQFKEDYPEVAARQEKVLAPLLSKLGKIETDVSGFTKERTEQELVAQYDAIVADHADYPEIKGSQAFRDWYAENQHIPMIREAIERNKDVAVDAAEVSRIVKMFKADTNWKASASKDAEAAVDGKGQKSGQEQTSAAASNSGGSSESMPRTALDEKRDAQLESSASPRNQGLGAVTNGIPNDAKGAWESFERMGL